MDVEKRGKVFKVCEEIFQKSDRDIILTIEGFIRNGLSLSRTAAKRHIQGNPLTCRLGRTRKGIPLDLRKFRDAVIPYTALLTWKETLTYEN